MVLPSHYWTGPLAALVAMALVLLICRWVFAPPARREPARATPSDYGLLVPVATARSADQARSLHGVLLSAGIRCTVAETDGGGAWQVLVFRADSARANELVG